MNKKDKAIEQVIAILGDVLNSDMVMREEDEGRVSEDVNMIRNSKKILLEALTEGDDQC